MEKVWNMLNNDTDEFIKVSDSWLDSIPRKNINELELSGDELKVTYSNGIEKWYKNIHGTWGFPTVFK